MTDEEYVREEILSGRLTYAEIAEMTRYFQSGENLLVDGKPGPMTQRRLNEITEARLGPAPITSAKFLKLPLPTLADGRRPVVTSAFRTKDRPNHDGVDLFYPWKKGDKPDFIGDRGCAGENKNGSPKWVVPYETMAIAAASGVVQIAGNTKTGYRLWIDHGNGLRSGYFHLLGLAVSVGQCVSTGQPLGPVGDNPADRDGRHLHFEVSPSDRYEPIDPEIHAKDW